MKKILALLIVLALFLSGCEYITIPGQNTPPIADGGNNTPDGGNAPDNTPDDTPEIPGTDPEKCIHAVTTTKNVKVATCTEEGYTGDIVCCTCELIISIGKAVAKSAHTYSGEKCLVCGYVKPDECLTHEDLNDNGECDVCGINVLIWYEFYSVNDLHGKFKDTDAQPGVDELTTFFKEAKKQNENVILLSAGDMWQGSAESNLTKGNIVTDWMNELGFVSMTLGNHEFDWGEEYIIDNAEIANFPFLAINIYEKATNEQVDYCESSIIVDIGGYQIGIIGAIGDCYNSILNVRVEDIYFKTGNELTNLVKAESVKLREQGADLIIYSLHSDGGDYDVSLSNGYIDLVFEGHTHSSYVKYDSYGVAHLQGGGENRGISYAKLSFNTANGNTKTETAKTIYSSVYKKYESDPLVSELLEKYKDIIGDAFAPLGYNCKYRNDSEIEALVAKLYYEYGKERWGDQYDIVLGGGSLNTRSPYDIEKGDVTYSQLQSIFPFDNDITLCAVKGADLLKKFINSNYATYYEIDASTIDPNKTYYLVTDTWTSDYAYNNLTEIGRYDPYVYARDLLAEYIKNGGWEQ